MEYEIDEVGKPSLQMLVNLSLLLAHHTSFGWKGNMFHVQTQCL